jgi:hypothetical protein
VVTGKLDVRAAAAALPETIEEPENFNDTEETEADDGALGDTDDADIEEAA